MDIVRGSVVKATAGKEKNGFYVVLKVDGRFAYIADGKRRRVDKPKKKSLVHLSATNTVIKEFVDTNPKIKRVLSQFN